MLKLLLFIFLNIYQRWIGTVRSVGNRKSRKSELAQKSELGNRKSEFFFGNRKSEIGRKKTSEIGSRKSEFRSTSDHYITKSIRHGPKGFPLLGREFM